MPQAKLPWNEPIVISRFTLNFTCQAKSKNSTHEHIAYTQPFNYPDDYPSRPKPVGLPQETITITQYPLTPMRKQELALTTMSNAWELIPFTVLWTSEGCLTNLSQHTTKVGRMASSN